MECKLYIYVLQLQDDMYYVGKTTNPKMRLDQHIAASGSEWTKLYKPKTIVEIFEGDNYDEDKTVKKYMARYGIDCVRGGSYVRIALSREEKALLQREIRMTENKCVRCGRNNHFVRDCYAMKDVDGKVISGEDRKNVSSERRECPRCGRNNHVIANCYAKIDVNGKVITEEDVMPGKKANQETPNVEDVMPGKKANQETPNVEDVGHNKAPSPIENATFSPEDPAPSWVERPIEDATFASDVSDLLMQVENMVASPTVTNAVNYIKSWF
jgi:predicted GIY-YIG superfamily endonuclease/ribosomal protein S27AE